MGLFQQRCNVGWCQCGAGSECLDPVKATRAFYGIASHTSNRGLTDISGWQSMSVSDAAQAVQVCKLEIEIERDCCLSNERRQNSR